METENKQTALEGEDASWSEVNEKASRYFKAEIDKGYKATFSDVKLAKRAFNKGDEPKLKAICTIATLDAQPSEKIWETGSFSVMKTLKKYVKDENWIGANVVFFLKRKELDGKTTFIFEELGEAVV
jgi:hypothetical protein